MTARETSSVTKRGIIVACDMVKETDPAKSAYDVGDRNPANAIAILKTAVPGIKAESSLLEPGSVLDIIYQLDKEFAKVDYNGETCLYFSAHGAYDPDFGEEASAHAWDVGFHGIMK